MKLGGDRIVVYSNSLLEPKHLAQIQAVDPRIVLKYRPEGFGTDGRQTAYPSEGRTAPANTAESVDEILAQADVLVGFRIPDDLRRRAPRLRWIQVLRAGLGKEKAFMGEGLVVTNARGLHAEPIAEYILGVMIYFAKDFANLTDQKRRRTAERMLMGELRGQTAGIIGLGGIGEATARLCRAHGMTVLATRRSTTERQVGVGAVDELYPAKDLPEVIRRADYLILTVPGTAETDRLIGEAEIAQMKSDAVLINVGRGSCVDEPALIRALREGRLRGAGLDVTATEPLPPESELYDLPNAFLSYHNAGTFTSYNDRAIE
ncbi:MAG TPA: D-2-hydroxyacid dehydrogenase, partial [Dehalococcoidia bacterium]|nr:D-2-hydroxyacid dehydrogenase [Dehalococcoidia bacterium]